MLSKTVKPGGQDWDACLPCVLFAYRATVQGNLHSFCYMEFEEILSYQLKLRFVCQQQGAPYV